MVLSVLHNRILTGTLEPEVVSISRFPLDGGKRSNTETFLVQIIKSHEQVGKRECLI